MLMRAIKPRINKEDTLKISKEFYKDPKKISATLDNQDKDQNIYLKRYFAYWTIGLLSLWMTGIYVLMFFYNIDNSVKITILTTTTVNLIGLPLIIIRSLFK